MTLPTTNFQNINLTLNWINNRVSPDNIVAVEDGDVQGRQLVFTLFDGTSKVVPNLTGCTAQLYWKHENAHISGVAAANISTTPINQILVPIPQAMQIERGQVLCNLRVADVSGTQIFSTRTFRMSIERSGIDLDAVEKSDQYSALDQLIIQFEGDIASIPLTINGVGIQVGSRNVILGADQVPFLSTDPTGVSTHDAIQQVNSAIAGIPETADMIPLSSGSATMTSEAIQSNTSSVASLAVQGSQQETQIQFMASYSSSTASQVAGMTGSNIPLTTGGAMITPTIDSIASSMNTLSSSFADLGTGAYATVGNGVGEIPPVMSNGFLNPSIIPSSFVNNVFTGLYADMVNETSAITGDIYITTDTFTTYILQGSDPTVLSNWVAITAPTTGVTFVNGQTGAVTLVSSDGSITVNGTDFVVNWGDMPKQTAYVYQNGDSVYAIADGTDINAGVATALTNVTDVPSQFSNWVTSPLNFTAIYRGNYSATTNPNGNGTITLYQSDTNIGYQTTVYAGVWSPWQEVVTVDPNFMSAGNTYTFNYTSNGAYTLYSSNGNLISSGTVNNAYSYITYGTYTFGSSKFVGSSILLSDYLQGDSTLLDSFYVTINADIATITVSTHAATSMVDLSSSVASLAVGESSASSAINSASSNISSLNTSTSSLSVAVSSNSSAIASVASSASSAVSSASSTTASVASSASSGISENSVAISNIVDGTTVVARATSATNANTANTAGSATDSVAQSMASSAGSQASNALVSNATNSTAISSVASSASSAVSSTASNVTLNSSHIASIIAGTTTVGMANQAMQTMLQTATGDWNNYTTAGLYEGSGLTNAYLGTTNTCTTLVYTDGADIYQFQWTGTGSSNMGYALRMLPSGGAWTAWQAILLNNGTAGWAQDASRIHASVTATATTNIDNQGSISSTYVPASVTVLGTPPVNMSGSDYIIISFLAAAAPTNMWGQIAIKLAGGGQYNGIQFRTYNAGWSLWTSLYPLVNSTWTQTTAQAIPTTSPTVLTGWTNTFVDSTITQSAGTFTITGGGLYRVTLNMGTTSTNNVTCNARPVAVSGCTVLDGGKVAILANNNNLNAIPMGDTSFTVNCSSATSTFTINTVYNYSAFTTGTAPSYGVLSQPTVIIHKVA